MLGDILCWVMIPVPPVGTLLLCSKLVDFELSMLMCRAVALPQFELGAFCEGTFFLDICQNPGFASYLGSFLRDGWKRRLYNIRLKCINWLLKQWPRGLRTG